MINKIKTWVDRMPCPPGSSSSQVGYMQAEIDELRAALATSGSNAAPAAANGALTDDADLGEGLPSLPEAIEVGGEGWGWQDFQSEKTFSAEHMFNYAREAIAAAGPDAALVALIHKAQSILAHHLPPDGPGAKTTISELLGLLDGPESRAALKPYGDV